MRRSRDQIRDEDQADIDRMTPPITVPWLPGHASVPVPVSIELVRKVGSHEPLLAWSKQTRGVQVQPGAVLQEFLRLEVTGERRDEQVLQFARKNGVLGLWASWPEASPAASVLVCGAVCERAESVAVWHDAARTMNAIIRIATRVRLNEPPDVTDLCCLQPTVGRSWFEERARDLVRIGRTAAGAAVIGLLHQVRAVPVLEWPDDVPTIGIRTCDDMPTWDWLILSSHRMHLHAIDEAVSEARLAGLWKSGQFPQAPLEVGLGPRPSPLFGLLVGQLVSVVTTRAGLYECHYCRAPHTPARKPKQGTRVVCDRSECKLANEREHKRESWRRHQRTWRPNARTGPTSGADAPGARASVPS
jgi:hypothetical protein